MKLMINAPHDRPFLARFTKQLGGDVVFCRFRPAKYRNGLDLNDPTKPRWDVSEAVFFDDDSFDGWSELPEGFEQVKFRD